MGIKQIPFLRLAFKGKPEALKSNIHGYIRGGVNIILPNHGVVEEVFQNFLLILFL
jgi:hypothetical protein